MVSGYTRYRDKTQQQLKDLKNLRKPIGGKEYDITRSPQYQQALAQLDQLGSYYGDLMNPEGQSYQNYAAPEMRNFQQEIMPDIAEQFAGVGGLSSSGFQNAAAGAGASLQEKLAALRSGLQMQGAQGMANLSQQTMNYGMMPYEMKMKLLGINQERMNNYISTPQFQLMKKGQKATPMWQNLLQSGLTAAATAYGEPIGGAAANWTMNKLSPQASSTGFAPGAASQWVGK